jgi:hypothetical protein
MLLFYRASSVFTIALGVGLSYIHLRWGIPCLALSIACAQWANHEENKLYAGWTQQTLMVVLESLHGINGKLDPEELGMSGFRSSQSAPTV